MISAHANLSRITTVPLNDPENWLYSQDVIAFAIEKKFYSTGSQKPFSYRDAYHPGVSPSQQRKPVLAVSGASTAGPRHPKTSPTPSFEGKKVPRTTRSSSSPTRRLVYPM